MVPKGKMMGEKKHEFQGVKNLREPLVLFLITASRKIPPPHSKAFLGSKERNLSALSFEHLHSETIKWKSTDQNSNSVHSASRRRH